jgi:ribosomal protein S18 acetylase RimI-like enzyme
MPPEFREAGPDDVETLLGMLRAFNASQTYPFDEAVARRALIELLGSAALGRVWLIVAAGAPVGYLALTLGHSLEYGGRDAFLDELFVEPGSRRRGLGRAALEFGLAQAAALGVRAVHLEVERGNESARALYRSLGFQDKDRQLLTRRLSGGRAGDAEA